MHLGQLLELVALEQRHLLQLELEQECRS
jgi:hypothetical protein